MSLPRISTIYSALAPLIAADPDGPVPASSIFLGREHVEETFAPPRIVFVPNGGAITKTDHSGIRQWPPVPGQANPRHLWTWHLKVVAAIWGGPGTWTPSTSFLPGQVVTNGSNAYQCITGGTSASSGGPSGSGSSIPDNTVTWSYVTPLQAHELGFDLCFNMMQAIIRACDQTIAGSYVLGEAVWDVGNSKKAIYGRSLDLPMIWKLPVVDVTFPTTSGVLTPQLSSNFTNFP